MATIRYDVIRSPFGGLGWVIAATNDRGKISHRYPPNGATQPTGDIPPKLWLTPDEAQVVADRLTAELAAGEGSADDPEPQAIPLDPVELNDVYRGTGAGGPLDTTDGAGGVDQS